MSDDKVIYPAGYTPPKPPPPPEVQCAVMGCKMIASLAGYGVWRLFGGSKENYPGVIDIF